MDQIMYRKDKICAVQLTKNIPWVLQIFSQKHIISSIHITKSLFSDEIWETTRLDQANPTS